MMERFLFEGGDSPMSQRKNNLLAMAQQFADLKAQCDSVLPYDAHKATLLSDRYCCVCHCFSVSLRCGVT